jgi:hypothetical protein
MVTIVDAYFPLLDRWRSEWRQCEAACFSGGRMGIATTVRGGDIRRSSR